MPTRLALARYGAFMTELAPDAEARLSDSERAYIARIRRPLRRAQFLRGRELLRQLLGDRDAAVEVDSEGRPQIRSHPVLHASIAHSADAVAAAVADQRVGVDIERARHWQDPTAVAALLSPAGTHPEPLRTWVAAEAQLKAGDAAGMTVWRACWADCEVALAGAEDPPFTVVFDPLSGTYNPLVLQWQMVQPDDRMRVDSANGR